MPLKNYTYICEKVAQRSGVQTLGMKTNIHSLIKYIFKSGMQIEANQTACFFQGITNFVAESLLLYGYNI